MKYFWNSLEANSMNEALHEVNGRSITYESLQKKVSDKLKKINNHKRQLIILKTSNDTDFVCMYLACLQGNHIPLLMDGNADESFLKNIFETYEPNYTYRNGILEKHSNIEHDLHQELALLLSTSGSTGSPKLIRLSKDNLHENAKSISEYLNLSSKEVAISSLPFFYSFGLSILNSHLYANASIVLTNESIITREFWSAVEDYGVTSFSGVPYTYQLLKKLGLKRFNIDSIRYFTQAGGKLDTDTVEYFHENLKAIGKDFFIMYGQTEATARMTYLQPEYICLKKGSIGIPIPGGRIELVDKFDNVIDEPNKPGEIIYYGPNVMLGYAETILDLSLGNLLKFRLATGDIAYFDSQGFYYITGRVSRFIKLFGLRISLDSVDKILSDQGFEAISSGNDDTLAIFIDNSDYDKSSIIKLLSSKLKLNLKTIKIYHLDQFPRNNNGKINYKKLTELANE